MRKTGLLAALLLAGCKATEPEVYVDIDAAVARMSEVVSSPPRLDGASESLPAQAGLLPSLVGGELAFGETGKRLEQARQILRENQRNALRSLTNALYRAYSSEAEAERAVQSAQLEGLSEGLWSGAFDQISRKLKQSAERRWPPATELAFLIGFPFSEPEAWPKPQNRLDEKRHREATAAWQTLLNENREFAEQAERILAQVEDEISRRRSEIQIDFTRRLNRSYEQAQSEATQAVAQNRPDYLGKFAEKPAVRVSAVASKPVRLEARSPGGGPTLPDPQSFEDRRRSLEHDLAIWLKQNGYRRAKVRRGVPDRTQEFCDWIELKRTGP